MQSLLLLLAAALSLGGVGLSQAQTREDLTRCRAIEDDERRLGCYDRIQLSTASPLSKFETVDIQELKEFALSFRGRLVEVTGWAVPTENFLQLGVDETDTTPMPVDFGALGRGPRQTFLEACGDGCYATVQGRVGPVNFTTGVEADSLIPH